MAARPPCFDPLWRSGDDIAPSRRTPARDVHTTHTASHCYVPLTVLRCSQPGTGGTHNRTKASPSGQLRPSRCANLLGLNSVLACHDQCWLLDIAPPPPPAVLKERSVYCTEVPPSKNQKNTVHQSDCDHRQSSVKLDFPSVHSLYYAVVLSFSSPPPLSLSLGRFLRGSL